MTATRSRVPRAAFVGVTFAGWNTRQMSLEVNVRADGRLDPAFHRVTGWNAGGLVERLPLPAGVAGRVRATLQSRPLAAFPRPDIVWTSAPELVPPYLWAFTGPFKLPLVVETDWTVDAQEAWAEIYLHRPPRRGAALRFARWRERAVFRRAARLVAMSRWAAGHLEAAGVPPERIAVIPPGVDLEAWHPADRRPSGERPLRLLFVGGDLYRKGGDLLVDLVRGPFAGRVELDVVTRDALESGRGVRVHRAEANSDALRSLYAEADLFALPSRAECFGIATVEAFASGLPAIVGEVGGTGDVVDHGLTGWLVEPTLAGVAAALQAALDDRPRLAAMGRTARCVAEQRFDGRTNDARLVDLMLEELERARGAR